MQGRKEEIFEYYRRLKEYTNKLGDSKLTELVNICEGKFTNYLAKVMTRKERNKMKTQKVNLDKLTRSEVKSIRKDLIGYNKRVLNLNHEEAKRLANIVVKAGKKGYEEIR